MWAYKKGENLIYINSNTLLTKLDYCHFAFGRNRFIDKVII